MLPIVNENTCGQKLSREEIAEIQRKYAADRAEVSAALFGRYGIPADTITASDQMSWAVIGHDDENPIFGIAFRVAEDGKSPKIHIGKWHSRRPLLSANSKLRKLPGRAGKYRAIGLALAPAAYSGKELCAWRTAACTMACNGFWSGMNVTVSTRLALIGRAILFNYFRPFFTAKLRKELQSFAKLCKRTHVRPAVRLNVSSDIVYERVLPDIFAEFPDTCFLDYTKALPRNRPTLPKNYELCHSFNERTKTADVEAIVAAGRNVVIAFDSAYAPSRGLWGALPKTVRFTDDSGRDFTLPVVNGDRHDLRLAAMDGRGVVVGLHGKSGRARVDGSVSAGFMLHHAEGQALRGVSRFIGSVHCHR
jgi:hypothetical protein